MGEHFIKPLFSKEYLGHVLLSEVMEEGFDHETVVVTDSGFEPECQPLIRNIENVYLIRLHRPGYDFSKDSRGYINPDGVKKTWDIEAEDVPTLQAKLVGLISELAKDGVSLPRSSSISD